MREEGGGRNNNLGHKDLIIRCRIVVRDENQSRVVSTATLSPMQGKSILVIGTTTSSDKDTIQGTGISIYTGESALPLPPTNYIDDFKFISFHCTFLDGHQI
ncbi:hypothetical protein BPOR_0013g00230 [Botrytis porri]|uniref:Uncharacterized protein n=1 Tax=Botrytis porri TaxID=87229 RepID=A0A4Z1L5A1_9HELO|nr:hypothetical protein BPOR_0013g00230 [Botrytis porri]